MPVQLIALDLDGTLLDSYGNISATNISAILDAQRNGIKVAICTGRSPEIAGLMIKDAGLDCPILGINGAVIAETPLGPHLIRHFMKKEASRRVFEILEKSSLAYCLFGEFNIAMRSEGTTHFTAIPFGDRLSKETRLVTSSGIINILSFLEQDVCKFVVWDHHNSDALETIRMEIDKVMNVEIMQSWSNNIEIMPRGINKGTAIIEYTATCNIPLPAVMSVGDQENDLPMLRITGYGVAMGNAEEKIKLSTRYRTDTCDNDGVAKAIYSIALPSLK